MSSPSSSSGIGSLTALGLGFVALLCIALIGGTGYLKYRLDQAEAVLASPKAAASPNGALGPFDRLLQEWGYGGFLGLAQRYVSSPDPAILTEMKNKSKAAKDVVARLPEKMPPEIRKEVSSIADLFDVTLKKLDTDASAVPAKETTAADFTALYAALPIIDAHREADNLHLRLAAQSQAQFWGMLLTLVSWFSLIIAAACCTGIYLVLRDRRSAPMQALAQSIQNMARGDMQTAIWGIERNDLIGELARSVDIARYHFSHLPDVSLMSDDGPVRLRFEGETRSLFEAMMKSVSTDSENIRGQSSSLTTAVKEQKQSLETLIEKVEDVLEGLARRGADGNQQIAKAIKEMVGGAESMKNAHAHTADQLSRLIPAIQDRAQGLAEITQITGKQLTHTLQSLASSEISLKSNAEQAKETLAKLSTSADGLSERLFGAINLLQASGKVLGETTETIRAQWNEMSPAQDWSARLEEMTQKLATLQSKMDAQADSQFGLAHALELSSQKNSEDSALLKESLLSPIEALSSLPTHTAQMMDQLNALQTKLEAQQTPTPLPNDRGLIEEKTTRINEQIALLQEKLDAQTAALTNRSASQGDLSSLEDKISRLVDLEGRVAVFVSALPGDLRQALKEELEGLSAESSASEIKETLASLHEKLGASSDLSRQLTEIGDGLLARLDDQRHALDAKQGDIAIKIAELEHALASAQRFAEVAQEEMKKPSGQNLSQELQKQFLDQWFQMSAQIEASRTSLIDSLSEQIRDLETRLAAQQPKIQTKTAADYTLQLQIEKQTEILTELVSTLGLIDSHMQQIKTQNQVRIG